jgi:hypothetical protein
MIFTLKLLSEADAERWIILIFIKHEVLYEGDICICDNVIEKTELIWLTRVNNVWKNFEIKL